MLGLLCPNFLDVFIIFSLGKLGLCVCLIPKYQSGELPKGWTLENWLCKDLFTYRKIYPLLDYSGLSLTVYTSCNCHPICSRPECCWGSLLVSLPFSPSPRKHIAVVYVPLKVEHTQHAVFLPYLRLFPSLPPSPFFPFSHSCPYHCPSSHPSSRQDLAVSPLWFEFMAVFLMHLPSAGIMCISHHAQLKFFSYNKIFLIFIYNVHHIFL